MITGHSRPGKSDVFSMEKRSQKDSIWWVKRPRNFSINGLNWSFFSFVLKDKIPRHAGEKKSGTPKICSCLPLRQHTAMLFKTFKLFINNKLMSVILFDKISNLYKALLLSNKILK